MKCIFVCDKNPVYADFWKPHAQYMYRAFGLESVLYYLTDEKAHTMYSSSYARVITIPLVPGIPHIVQALLAKWYFPAIESSDEPVLICDIDCFILSKDLFREVASSDTLFHLKSYEQNVPGYYIYGTPRQLREFFKVGDMTFSEFCMKILMDPKVPRICAASQANKDASPDWKYFCIEEYYAFNCAKEYTHAKRDTMVHPQPGQNRICRSNNCYFSREKLQNNEYIDFHSPRPYHDNSSLIQSILVSVQTMQHSLK